MEERPFIFKNYKNLIIRDRIRTCNLSVRSRTRYPLRHTDELKLRWKYFLCKNYWIIGFLRWPQIFFWVLISLKPRPCIFFGSTGAPDFQMICQSQYSIAKQCFWTIENTESRCFGLGFSKVDTKRKILSNCID